MLIRFHHLQLRIFFGFATVLFQICHLLASVRPAWLIFTPLVLVLAEKG